MNISQAFAKMTGASALIICRNANDKRVVRSNSQPDCEEGSFGATYKAMSAQVRLLFFRGDFIAQDSVPISTMISHRSSTTAGEERAANEC